MIYSPPKTFGGRSLLESAGVAYQNPLLMSRTCSAAGAPGVGIASENMCSLRICKLENYLKPTWPV